MQQASKAGISAGSRSHVEDPMPRRILTRQETGPRGCAVGRAGIGRCKHRPAARQLVQVRRLIEIRPHETGIFPTQIVEIEKQNVGAFRRSNLGLLTAQRSERARKTGHHRHQEQQTTVNPTWVHAFTPCIRLWSRHAAGPASRNFQTSKQQSLTDFPRSSDSLPHPASAQPPLHP